MAGSNGDLWETREAERGANRNNKATKKMKAYAHERVLEGSMEPELYLLNAVADAVADVYANILSTERPIGEMEKWHAYTFNIAMRFATIQAEINAQIHEQVPVFVDLEEPRDRTEVPEEMKKTKRMIERRGHKLVREDAFLRCVRCQRRRRNRNIRYFTKADCLTSGPKELQSEKEEEKQEVTETKEPKTEMVTRSKRRKLVQQRLQQEQEARRIGKRKREEADVNTAREIASELPEGVVEEETKTPFKLHPSHRLVELGGYYTCVKCAATESRPTNNNRLTKECRNSAPPGSMWRTVRVVEGLHPRESGAKWPSGEKSPRPKRLKNEMDQW